MTAMERAAGAVRELAEASAINNGWGISEEQATDFARAVLMAVREPSRIEQVWEIDGRLANCTPDVAEGWRQEYQRIWTGMIDAILNATPDPWAGG